jgi:hypothetical protein
MGKRGGDREDGRRWGRGEEIGKMGGDRERPISS